MTLAETRQAAEAAQSAGHADRARQLRSWLAEIRAGQNSKDDAKTCGEAIASPPGQ